MEKCFHLMGAHLRRLNVKIECAQTTLKSAVAKCRSCFRSGAVGLKEDSLSNDHTPRGVRTRASGDTAQQLQNFIPLLRRFAPHARRRLRGASMATLIRSCSSQNGVYGPLLLLWKVPGYKHSVGSTYEVWAISCVNISWLRRGCP
jgi:hypothetical protein